MKNKTLLVTSLIMLIGCNAPYHVKKARKHTQKALDKGVSIPKDTVTITKSDTIRTTFTRNDTIFTELRIVDTITLEPTIEIRTKRVDRWMTKYKFKEVKVENKAMVDSLKQLVKIERQKTKQTKAENRRSNWWKWMLLGVVIGLFSILAIKQIKL